MFSITAWGTLRCPVPDKFTRKMIELLETKSPMELHGYSPHFGKPGGKGSGGRFSKKTFHLDYAADHIFMTSGAASSLAHAFRAVTVPGDTILTFAPYFPEYGPYVNLTGAHLKVGSGGSCILQIDFQTV